MGRPLRDEETIESCDMYSGATMLSFLFSLLRVRRIFFLCIPYEKGVKRTRPPPLHVFLFFITILQDHGLSSGLSGRLHIAKRSKTEDVKDRKQSLAFLYGTNS